MWKHWQIPPGPPNSHTRAWIAFRAQVRATLARGCTAETVHEPTPEDLREVPPGVEVLEVILTCGTCAACEAHELVMRGLA